MDELLVVLKSLGAKITLSVGTLAGIVMSVFVINRKLDERIDQRSMDVVVDEIITQRDKCKARWGDDMQKCLDNSPRLERIEANIENIGKNVDTILNLHLNGGRKS